MVNMDVTLMNNVGKSTSVSKSKPGKDNEDSFKTMLDKSSKPVESDTPKAEAKEDVKDSNVQENTAPKAEEEGEALEGTELQAVVQQYMMSNEQQKITLNWAETVVQTEGQQEVAVQAVGEQQTVQAVQTVETELVQAGQAVQTAEQHTVVTQIPEQAAQVVAENAPKQEQQDTEAVLVQEVQTEAKETKHVTLKGAETQNAEAGQQELKGKEQKAVETTEPAMVQKEVSKEETLVQVKVGEAVELAAPKAAETLADTVLVKMLENTNEYELQLQPEELGKIKIKLVIEEGKISIAMSCENQKAADLLGLTSARLKGIIEERTGSETTVEVEHENDTPYEDQENSRNDSGREYQESEQKEKQSDDVVDFLQQLRLGLLDM